VRNIYRPVDVKMLSNKEEISDEEKREVNRELSKIAKRMDPDELLAICGYQTEKYRRKEENEQKTIR